MKFGLALDVQAKKKKGTDEVVHDMPSKGDNWDVRKDKIAVAWWDRERQKT